MFISWECHQLHPIIGGCANKGARSHGWRLLREAEHFLCSPQRHLFIHLLAHSFIHQHVWRAWSVPTVDPDMELSCPQHIRLPTLYLWPQGIHWLPEPALLMEAAAKALESGHTASHSDQCGLAYKYPGSPALSWTRVEAKELLEAWLDSGLFCR